MRIRAMYNGFEVTIVGFVANAETSSGEPLAVFYSSSYRHLAYDVISKFMIIDHFSTIC